MRRDGCAWSLLCLLAILLMAPRDASAVTIRFDYRFDDGYFSQHPERRKTLELAAEIWAELLPDRFERIAPGTVIRFKHPKTGKPLIIPMPQYDGDVLVFVVGFPQGSKARAAALHDIHG